MAVRNYRELIAWQKAMDFVERVYVETRRFPKDELYGLTTQLRRAAVSIPSNIAEGQGRRSSKEFVQFLYVAKGSLQESETQILLAGRLGYLTAESVASLPASSTEEHRLLNGLINAIDNKAFRCLLSTAHCPLSTFPLLS